MNTAERIKAVRGRLTQAEFADRLGLHKNTLGRYERGESEPDISICANICSVFGVNSQWLLFGSGPMHLDDPAEQLLPAVLSTASTAPEPVPQVTCPRCARLEAKLEKLESKLESVEAQRDDLVLENRQLGKENGEYRERLARYEERAIKPDMEEPDPGDRPLA